ncbi:MAG: hypothetical protein QOD74_2025 [Variibacter sp.]|nr:hypothetical protein [Variibacter sp.]
MAERRKLIAFDEGTWTALDLLSRDSLKSIQELADEAFADLLKKHHRPVTLKEALRQSVRREPANDPAPKQATRAEGKNKATPAPSRTVPRRKRR